MSYKIQGYCFRLRVANSPIGKLAKAILKDSPDRPWDIPVGAVGAAARRTGYAFRIPFRDEAVLVTAEHWCQC
jgi:hypothetical protein